MMQSYTSRRHIYIHTLKALETNYKDSSTHTLLHKILDKAQEAEKSVLKLLHEDTAGYHMQEFHRAGKLITLYAITQTLLSLNSCRNI